MEYLCDDVGSFDVYDDGDRLYTVNVNVNATNTDSRVELGTQVLV